MLKLIDRTLQSWRKVVGTLKIVFRNELKICKAFTCLTIPSLMSIPPPHSLNQSCSECDSEQTLHEKLSLLNIGRGDRGKIEALRIVFQHSCPGL